MMLRRKRVFAESNITSGKDMDKEGAIFEKTGPEECNFFFRPSRMRVKVPLRGFWGTGKLVVVEMGAERFETVPCVVTSSARIPLACSRERDRG
jgi:hypothetical protein